MVDIEPVKKMDKNVNLSDMRENSLLDGMPLLMRGQRLSVQPVSKEHFKIICEMGEN